MENKTNSTKGIVLNHGLILGAISILIAATNFAIGDPFKPHWSIAIISIAASITIIMMGLLKFRKAQDGAISLGQSLKAGLGIALVSGIVYVIFQIILTTFVDPEFYTKMIEFQRETMIEQYPDMSDEQLETSLEMAQKFTSPYITAAFTLIGSIFSGFIISLIGGLIIKRENPYKELDQL